MPTDPVELDLPATADPHLREAYLRQRKDRDTAFLLQLLSIVSLPGIGRMYLGEYAVGVAQFFLSYLTCGVLWLWPLIDIIRVKEATDRHNRELLQRLLDGR